MKITAEILHTWFASQPRYTGYVGELEDGRVAVIDGTHDLSELADHLNKLVQDGK